MGERIVELYRLPDRSSAFVTEPRPGKYRHYKGGEYEVIGIARHSETHERLG